MQYSENLLDMNTGEHIGKGYFITDAEYKETQHKKEKQSEGYKYYKNNILPLPGFLQEEYGEFIQTRYDPLLKEIKYDTATAFRFIYISTFMNYTNGYLIYKNNKVNKHTLSEILQVSRNSFTQILNTLLNHKLLMIDSNGYYYINSKYCYRGAISNNKEYHERYTRIFINSIRELYSKASTPREHKLLGRFILILPYINIYHNIICKNIKEKEIENLLLPNSAELDQILHVSERHSDRTMKELLEITVGGKPAIMNVSHNKAKMYTVNPSIYYGGTNLSHLKEIDQYFKAEGGLDK